MTYINISGYKFTKLENLSELQANLKSTCLSLKLKGSILLSHEGINAFLSGMRREIDEIYAYLDQLNIAINFKESPSKEPPFKRMLVKIKDEIIYMGVPEISPAKNPAPEVSAEEFKQWLDEKREVIILDTRNEYEVLLGTFKNAINLNINAFSEFPEAVKKLKEELKNKTIVTFCTGGIRCEKAAPFLMAQGFKDVYQLEGGILKYFEKCGQSHYEGECFVFDKRIAVNSQLEQTPTVQCMVCRAPVTLEQQRSAEYIADKSCPRCIES